MEVKKVSFQINSRLDLLLELFYFKNTTQRI